MHRYITRVRETIAAAYGPDLFEEFGTRVAELIIETVERDEIDDGFTELEVSAKEREAKAAELEGLEAQLERVREVLARSGVEDNCRRS